MNRAEPTSVDPVDIMENLRTATQYQGDILTRLCTELRQDEGLRHKPYLDTAGKLTIGVGRNLDGVGITEEEAEFLLNNDIHRLICTFESQLPWWTELGLRVGGSVRQRILVNMAFNLGFAGLMRFKKMLAAVQQGDYALAAREMLNSKWAQQVGQRATRLARRMETGLDPQDLSNNTAPRLIA